MNILYHFRTQGTGAEGVHVAGLVRAFEAMGHTVTLSSPTGNDPRQTAGANPFGGAKRGRRWVLLAQHCPGILFEFLEIFYNVVALLRNWRIVRRERCAMIYERHAFFLFSTAFLARLRRLPLVIEVNELVGDERIRKQPVLSWVARLCDRYTFRRAQLIVVVSPHLKRRICEMGVDPDKILVLPNGVRREDYEKSEDRDALRARYGIGSERIVVGFVGWFVHWHFLNELVKACAALAGSHPEVHLMLVGDGPLREELESLAVAQGLEGRFLITGAVPHESIPAHIAAMDVGVIPHSNEYRSPIKLFEYMGRGIAVLAPDTEPIRMAVENRRNGLLFANGDRGSLQATLAELLADPALRSELGSQARRDVLEKHTWVNNATAVLKAIGLA